MDKEKRHLIMGVGDEIRDEYEQNVKMYKENGDTNMAYTYTMMAQAILRYQIAILTLDKDDKI